MDETRQQALRALPSVEELLSHPIAALLVERFSRPQVLEAVRTAVDGARRSILADVSPGRFSVEWASGALGGPAASEALLAEAAALLDAWAQPSLRRVVNLSGVVIHTNLGRSALSERAVERVVEVARTYCNLEYDLKSGTRGTRESHVEALLKRVTGAERPSQSTTTPELLCSFSWRWPPGAKCWSRGVSWWR